MSYVYIFLTILFTVYGQIVLKWQVGKAGVLPPAFSSKILFLLSLFFNPWVLSGFLAAFLASLAWMSAMTKLPLSTAYPYMSLSFIFVTILSVLFFHEVLTINKVIALILIISGIIVLNQ